MQFFQPSKFESNGRQKKLNAAFPKRKDISHMQLKGEEIDETV